MGGYLCVLLSVFEAGLVVCEVRPSTDSVDIYVLIGPFLQMCAV